MAGTQAAARRGPLPVPARGGSAPLLLPTANKEARAAARAPAILGGARSSRLVQPSSPRRCSSSPAPTAHQACPTAHHQLRSPASSAALPTCSPPAPSAPPVRGPAVFALAAVPVRRRAGAQPHPSMAAAGPRAPLPVCGHGRPARARSWPRSVPSCGGLAPPPPVPGRGHRGTARRPGVEQRDGQKNSKGIEDMLQRP
ncbi:hypothetical protein PAHAL_9G619500 [Panicum hallii]|jgi:hypothetical protein|uniref:Uncharacterized protein n=1 Tax=Panicum hallii TaxID=206008 RepID=A0A2T8I6J4_9POAL|nr:predicted GPI-anchored protein 58 [Panicum hallii]PVH33292.1 hypothetical protein PAHAL_9G619500 [Panicum hallii]